MRSGRATDTLQFRILGRLEVRGAGGCLHLEGRRQRTLLALLILEANRVGATDDLLDDLWGGQPPPPAMATLQAYVSKLRGILEPDRPARTPPRVLVSQPPGYVLRAAPERSDAHQFVALTDAARVALDEGEPRRALALLDRALAAAWGGGGPNPRILQARLRSLASGGQRQGEEERSCPTVMIR